MFIQLHLDSSLPQGSSYTMAHLSSIFALIWDEVDLTGYKFACEMLG